MMFVIVSSITLFVLESDASFESHHLELINELETGIIVIFTTEFTLRVNASFGLSDFALEVAHATGLYKLTELACTLSHLKAIRQAYEDGAPTALIMEDDASLEYVCESAPPTHARARLLSYRLCPARCVARWQYPQWDSSLAELIDAAPSGWQVLQLATNNPDFYAEQQIIYDRVHSFGRIGRVNSLPRFVADSAQWIVIQKSPYSAQHRRRLRISSRKQ